MTRREIAIARKIAREEFGVRSLLSFDRDPKTRKSNRAGQDILTVVLYLAPHTLGGQNVCASATPGCITGCLHTAGNLVYQRGKDAARLARKRLFFVRRDVFETLLRAELMKWRRVAELRGCKLAVRLNGTSDIVWECIFPQLFTDFVDVQFYDYTKNVKRVRVGWQLPANYDLTLSRSERNDADCVDVLRNNPRARVAVVFSTKRTRPLPVEYLGHDVDDGDTHDLLFLRPAGIVGLRAKGAARRDDTGFVVKV